MIPDSVTGRAPITARAPSASTAPGIAYPDDAAMRANVASGPLARTDRAMIRARTKASAAPALARRMEFPSASHTRVLRAPASRLRQTRRPTGKANASAKRLAQKAAAPIAAGPDSVARGIWRQRIELCCVPAPPRERRSRIMKVRTRASRTKARRAAAAGSPKLFQARTIPKVSVGTPRNSAAP